MRIFTVSDIHIDYSENEKWLKNISKYDYIGDVLIIPGDISDDIRLVETAFKILGSRFNKVVFTPGNHDLWVVRDNEINSFEKFSMIYKLAKDHGVLTQGVDIGKLKIIPILGWYDYTFGYPSNRIKEIWTDYYACKWPEHMGEVEISQQFFNMNEENIYYEDEHIITFSHFVPRIDIIQSYVPKHRYILNPVLGSARIEDHIRAIGSHIHIYGHSHINMHVRKDNVLYINNAYGYPREVYTRKGLKMVLEV